MSTVKSRNINDYTPSPGAGGGSRKTIWQRSTTAVQPVDASVYAVKAGRTWPADHYHPHCSELVLVWGGTPNTTSGTILFQLADPAPTWQQWEANPKWQQQVYSIDLVPGDTVIVPRGAVHRFTARPGKNLVLLVVHVEEPLEKNQALGASIPTAPPQIATFKRNLDTPPNIDSVPSRRRRAKRNRVWGMDPNAIALPNAPGLPNPQGLPDLCKYEFNVIHYVFKPGQWNAEHFHPRSVELVICRQGSAEASVVMPEKPGVFPDWDRKTTTPFPDMQPGDTLIVPIAALHEYWNAHGTDDLLLLAMQTPQPIMHITRAMIEAQSA